MMDLITQIFLSHERWLTYFQHSGSKNLDHYYQNIIISQVDKSSPLCDGQKTKKVGINDHIIISKGHQIPM